MGRGSLIGVLVLWVLVAPVAAQGPGQLEYGLEVEVSALAAPIVPITEGAAVPFEVTVTCGMTEHDFLASTPMTLSAVSDAPWATVVVTPSTWEVEYHMEDCFAGVPTEMNGTVQVRLAAEAPAAAPVPLRLTVKLGEFEEKVVWWNETAGVYVRAGARFDQSVFKAAPGSTVQVPLTVENLANGPIRVRSEAVGNGSSDLQVKVPDLFDVAAGGSATEPVTVTVPGTILYTNERYDVRVRVVAVSAVDGKTEDQPVTLTAAIQVQGTVADEAPAPLVPVFLGAALLLVAARRRLVQQ